MKLSFSMEILFRSTSWFTLSLLIFLLASCSSDAEECAVQPDVTSVSLSFESLEDSLLAFDNKDELKRFFDRHQVVRDHIFQRQAYPHDSVFINELFFRFSNPHFDTLVMETRRVFQDKAQLRNDFIQAFSNFHHYYPQAPLPKIQTIISGLDTDLFVSDSLIIVGLDFYLGRGAKYRPRMYDYLLRKYDPQDIVPSCMLIFGISPNLNLTQTQDHTVLADMIAYGKSFYFAKHMQPCIPDSVLISYAPEEITGARKNQDLIWARFVESEVLYSTSHIVKKDYLGERPNTIQVGEKCPGRIGQWVGWQIVNAYMKNNPETSLQELMRMRDADQLFKQSGYKPSKR